MTKRQNELRRWARYSTNNPVLFTSNGKSRKGFLRDISAGGAAFDLEDPHIDDERGMLSIDQLGAYEAQIIRDMDDGFAVMLSLDDSGQSTLQDELAAYFHKDERGFD